MKRVIKMEEIHAVIDRIIQRPVKEYTKEEAGDLLRKLGVIDESGNIVGAYKEFFVEKNKKDETK